VVIHRRAGTHFSRPCHRPFRRRPRFRAVAWLPWRLWVPFRLIRGWASRSPWVSSCGTVPFRQLHPLRSFVPPCESVRASSSCPEPVVAALLDFFPSRAFSVRALDSLTRPEPLGLGLAPDPRVGCATSWTRRSARSGEAIPATEAPRRPRRRLPVPKDGSAPPLDGDRSPSALVRRAHPTLLTLGALQHAKSYVSPQRSLALLGFLASSPTS